MCEQRTSTKFVMSLTLFEWDEFLRGWDLVWQERAEIQLRYDTTGDVQRVLRSWGICSSVHRDSSLATAAASCSWNMYVRWQVADDVMLPLRRKTMRVVRAASVIMTTATETRQRNVLLYFYPFCTFDSSGSRCRCFCSMSEWVSE